MEGKDTKVHVRIPINGNMIQATGSFTYYTKHTYFKVNQIGPLSNKNINHLYRSDLVPLNADLTPKYLYNVASYTVKILVIIIVSVCERVSVVRERKGPLWTQEIDKKDHKTIYTILMCFFFTTPDLGRLRCAIY